MGDAAKPAAWDTVDACAPGRKTTLIVWLQLATLAWMLAECGLSIYAAQSAHSPAMLAFGSDSLVELLSATVVLLQYTRGFSLSEQRASRAAAVLLFLLAAVVTGTAIGALVLHIHPETSWLGMGVTAAALIAMPVLAWLKRREARRQGNRALAADAVQSATCAYLALVTLMGVASNAAFHLPWLDSVAALVAVPLLLREGREAWRGEVCGCCQAG
jgi:divalent metal cation (Fe/Co/Zn/Cd) transporter